MDPDHRILLQVTLDDAAAADEIFAVLMGEDVESPPRLHPAQRPRRALPRHLTGGRGAAEQRPGIPALCVLCPDNEGDQDCDRAAADRDRSGRRRRPQHRDAAQLHRLRDDASSSAAPCRTCATASSRCTAACVYAMYDGGYRPDRGYNKCARVVGEVMGQYHPHGDSLDLRRPGAPGPGLVAALPAGRRPGQLRLPRQRPGGRAAIHRVPDGAARDGDGPRHRPGDRRLPATTTTARRRSRSSCRAGSRTCWSTAPPASPSAWPPRSRRTTCARSRPASQWYLAAPGRAARGPARGADRA